MESPQWSTGATGKARPLGGLLVDKQNSRPWLGRAEFTRRAITHHILMTVNKHQQSCRVRLLQYGQQIVNILLVILPPNSKLAFATAPVLARENQDAHIFWFECFPAHNQPHNTNAPSSQSPPPLTRLLHAGKGSPNIANGAHIVKLGSASEWVDSRIFSITRDIDATEEEGTPVRVGKGISRRMDHDTRRFE